MPTATEERRFRGDVEGLRAVAILAVVLYHAGLFSGGYIGVDVFFVISGYLITGLLWREVLTTGRISFSAFYARRARRLLPSAMVVLVVTVGVAAVVLSPLAEHTVTKDATSAALYVANFRFAALRTDYLNASTAPSPLQHYWSLAVEEQFYLVWPLLVLVTVLAWRRVRTGALAGVAATLGLLGVASFLLSVHLTDVSQPWAFFSLPTRAWEFVAGGLVALGLHHLRAVPKAVASAAGWLGIVLVVWSAIRLTGATAFPGLAAAVPVGGTVLLLAAGEAAPRRGMSVLLARRPMLRIGKLSYAWYLWHWPVLTLAAAAAGHSLPVVENLVLSGVSLGLAHWTVELLENPIRFSPRLVSRPGRSLAMGATLTVLATVSAIIVAATLPELRGSVPAQPLTASLAAAPVGTLGAGSGSGATASGAGAAAGLLTPVNPFDPALAAVQAAVDRAVNTRLVPSNLDPSLDDARASEARPFLDGCDGGYTDAAIHPCIYGDKRSSTTVVIFGDSHAAQWYPAVAQLGATRDWRIISLTKAVCPPVMLSIWSPVLQRPFRECTQWRDAAIRYIAGQKPALVFVGAARHYGPEYHFNVYGPDWISGLQATVNIVRATGAKVIVLGPVPHPKGNVPECLSEHLSDVTACTQPLDAAIGQQGISAEAGAVVAAGGAYVDVTPWMCNSQACAVIFGNLLVFRDDNHLTTTFAAWLAPVIGARVNQVLPAPAGPPAGPAPPAGGAAAGGTPAS